MAATNATLMKSAIADYKKFVNDSRKSLQTHIRVLPPPSLANKPDLDLAVRPKDLSMEDVPEHWNVAPRVAQARLSNAELDRTFGLFNVVKHKTEEELEIGRIWTPNYQGEYEVRAGDRWGDTYIGLQPVFAGLTEEAFDRTAATALQNLPYAFSGSRASDFSARGRHAVRDLAMRPFNAMRYLMRLAVLYVSSILIEDMNDELEASVDGHSVDIKWVNTTGVLNAVVTEAVKEGVLGMIAVWG
jgi:hypothetical protein